MVLYAASMAALPLAMSLSVLDDADDQHMFDKEAAALASLHHPNIPRFFGIAEISNHFLLVTEFVEHSLNDLIEHRGRRKGISDPAHPDLQLPITRQHVVNILAGVADAMAFIHEKGFLHRDIKPNK